MADIDSLGAPSLKLGTFVLWVHGRQYPDSEDAWDGNWLNVTAHCGASGSRVVVSGAVLDTASLARWRTALRGRVCRRNSSRDGGEQRRTGSPADRTNRHRAALPTL